MNHEINNAINQPSSSSFPTNNCYIYEWYKTLKKLILQNNDESSETHYRLIVINGVYVTRHVTHSITY